MTANSPVLHPDVEGVAKKAALPRRMFLIGALAGGGALMLPGCASMGGFSLTEAIRRMMVLSSERAFARLTADGGLWDQSVRQIGLDNYLNGGRGDVLGDILTSALYKSRMERVVANIAVDASYRAAPIVAEAVRTIGIGNAMALVRGGPTAATSFLRQEMGMALINAMIPGMGDALRVAQDPLMQQVLEGLTGVNVTGLVNNFAGRVNDVIWQEMGREEASIRADPAATRDPVLISVFGASGAL